MARSLLDIGCFDGTFLQHFKKRFPQISYFGLDLSYPQLLRAKKNYYLLQNLVAAKAENLPLVHDGFDIIVCSAILHHVQNVNLVLDEVVRICKTGGSIVIIEPNRFNPFIFLLSLIKSHERGQLHLSSDKIMEYLKEKGLLVRKEMLNSLIYPYQNVPSAGLLNFFKRLEDIPLFVKFIGSHFIITATKSSSSNHYNV